MASTIENTIALLTQEAMHANAIPEIEAISFAMAEPGSLSIEDILAVEKDPLAQAIDAFDQASTEAGPEPEKNGFNPGFIVEHHHGHKPVYPLHTAVRTGSIMAVECLIKAGADVNQEDHLSSRPLHLAAFFGHDHIAKILIKNGAEIDDLSAHGESALITALRKHHYDVARTLVKEGKANPNDQVINYQEHYNKQKGKFEIAVAGIKTKSALATTIDRLEKCMEEYINNKAPHSLKEIYELINTIEVFSKHCGEHCLVTQAITASGNQFPASVSLILKVFAAKSPTAELRESLLALSEKIAATDPSEKIIVNALNLLQTFPTGECYQLKISRKKGDAIYIKSEGHFEIYTTKLAQESISAYLDTLKAQNADPIKVSLFEKISDIYTQSADFVTKIGDPETAINALKHYNHGDTVLLTTGWAGHFVNVILSKTQGLYAVANSGIRHDDDPAGTKFYHITDPDQIDEQFIHNVLTNEDQQALEYDNTYQYGFLERIEILPAPDQQFGNCTWESHRDAVEGILYIELLNKGVNADNAKMLAHEYFQEWDQFHGHYELEQYLANEPAISANAYADIFVQLHKKVELGEFSEHDAINAQKLAQTLTSPKFVNEFKSWLKHAAAKPTGEGPNVKDFEAYQVDVNKLIPKKGLADYLLQPFTKLASFFSGENHEAAPAEDSASHPLMFSQGEHHAAVPHMTPPTAAMEGITVQEPQIITY